MNRKRFTFAGIAIVYLLLLIVLTLLAPFLSPYDPLSIQMDRVLEPPSHTHLFGTDELGRDVLTRLLYGGRVSLLVGAAAMLLSIIVGVGYGAISAIAGGMIDRVMMRIVDAFLSIPALVIMIGLQLLFTPGLTTVVLVIGLTSWVPVARMIRMELMGIKQDVFIQASTVIGATSVQLLRRHLLPQSMPTIIVMAISGISHAILAETTLSFLGIGIPPHEPSWGNMLMGAQSHLLAGAWWLATFPGICITFTVLAFTYIGDKLQDLVATPQFRQGGEHGRLPS